MMFWLGDVTRNSAQIGAVVLGIALCGVMLAVGVSKCNVDELVEAARVEARAKCEKERAAAECDALIEANHEACGSAATISGSRHSGSTRVDQHRYYQCVTLGIEEHQRRRRESKARELANPLDGL
jgi:hypothetical protein